MIMLSNQPKRYEIKFLPSEVTPQEIEFLILTHPMQFKKINYKRKVNNIYFDTFGLKAFLDNIEGETNRKKVRLRWYGEMSDISKKAVLEIKYKSGPLGWKKRYNVLPVNVDIKKKFSTSDVLNLPIKKNEDNSVSGEIDLEFWEPTIINSYERDYFLSADKRFRITIDTKLEFFDVNPFKKNYSSPLDRDQIVLEIKFLEKDFSISGDVTGFFPFRISKNSKYITAIDRIRNWRTN